MKFVKTEFNETDPHFDENIDDIKLPSFIEVTQILIDDQFQDEPKIPVKPRRNKFIIDLKVDPVSGRFYFPSSFMTTTYIYFG